MRSIQRSAFQLVIVVTVGMLPSCDPADPGRQEGAPEAALPQVAAPPPSPPPPWFSGKWQGSSSLHTLEPALVIDSRERDPKKKQATGPATAGTLGDPATAQDRTISVIVRIADDKTISGEAQLDVGDSETLSVRGLLDEETLRLTLSGAQAAGTLVALRKEQALEGVLRLSKITGDGPEFPATAYETKLELSRQPPANTP